MPVLPALEREKASGHPFTSADLLLSGTVLASLLLIEPLEGFDTSASVALSRDVSDRGTFYRKSLRTLGAFPVGAALTGATFLAGAVSGSSTVRRVGLHTLESLVLAATAAQVLKVGIGRARPDVAGDSDVFQPLSTSSGFNSFPSGHAANSFAIAATLSHELRREAPWVAFVAYPVATAIAVSRVQDRRHWVTDVVAGAAVGVLSARFVARFNGGPSDAAAVSFGLMTPPGGGIGAGVSIALP